MRARQRYLARCQRQGLRPMATGAWRARQAWRAQQARQARYVARQRRARQRARTLAAIGHGILLAVALVGFALLVAAYATAITGGTLLP